MVVKVRKEGRKEGRREGGETHNPDARLVLREGTLGLRDAAGCDAIRLEDGEAEERRRGEEDERECRQTCAFEYIYFSRINIYALRDVQRPLDEEPVGALRRLRHLQHGQGASLTGCQAASLLFLPSSSSSRLEESSLFFSPVSIRRELRRGTRLRHGDKRASETTVHFHPPPPSCDIHHNSPPARTQARTQTDTRPAPQGDADWLRGSST